MIFLKLLKRYIIKYRYLQKYKYLYYWQFIVQLNKLIVSQLSEESYI